MDVEVRDLTKRYGQFTAVDDVSFVAEGGELTTLVGASGSGKTTTLNCIAGIEKPDQGVIEIGGTTVSNDREGVFVAPNRRDIGFVFQTFDVWPHMTVFENVAYPLQVQGEPADRIARRVDEVLSLTGIEPMRDKPATMLSGGQQARVSICRAIVYEPKVLLLDEPMTGLDRNLRKRLRTEVRNIQQQLDITTIYVTHSQPDAISISDKICLMRDGIIEDSGPPAKIYNNPATRYAFTFFGDSPLFDGTAADGIVETELGNLRCARDVDTHGEVTLGIRPEHVQLVTEAATDGDPNVLPACVSDIVFYGNYYDIHLVSNGVELRARQNTIPDDLAAGDDIHVRIPEDRIIVFPD